MKLVFCGTPDFAVPCLQAILDAGHEVALVLTQPDRPAGRKMELHAPPVKTLALAHNLPILQPEKIKTNAELRSTLESIRPDVIVVVAYGRIIPGWMLELPRFGCVNVHGSLLPKYRGAAPIQWAVANGEQETGVTIMRLDAGLDTGDILLERSIFLSKTATAAELFPQLSHLGSSALIEALKGLEDGSLQPQSQNHAAATLAPILSREDGLLLLKERPAEQVYNRWRGFYPWPGAHGIFRGKRFLVHKMAIPEISYMLEPGELSVKDGALLVGTAQGTAITLEEVQLEGKPRLVGINFMRDFQVKPGERLE
jgi:methionyl-tRNA formyltransferase